MTARTLFSGILIAAFPFLCSPHSAHAQAIRGVVLDDESGTPVRDVSVMLLGLDGDVERATLTDNLGEFLMSAPRTGRYRIQLDRLGYESTISTEVDLLPPDTLAVELRMAVSAVLLAPLTVTSERAPLVMDTRLASWGYYDRRAQYSTLSSGVAHFLDPEDIRKRDPSRVTDLFRDLHGTRVASLGWNRVRVQRPDRCGFSFYLDGVEVRLDSGEGIDDLVMASHVTAVEVYTRPPYPAQYAPVWFGHRRGRNCGSIVIWTGFVGDRGKRDH